MNFVAVIAISWWALSVALLLASALAAAAFPRMRRRRSARRQMQPVSAIVPIDFLEADFVGSQASLFGQTYPQYEILFAVSGHNATTMAAARRLQDSYPAVPSRIVSSNASIAGSPKLNTLWNAYASASHDLILTKDSNIRLEPGDLGRLVGDLTPGVGLVSTISIATAPKNLAAWIEASIVNNYHARMLMLAAAAGLGFGCGKIMLFRRSDLDRAGGLQGVAWALGEDAALASTMARLGLRIVLADRASHQVLGSRKPLEIWHRQVRWMLIWRKQVPLVFVADAFCSALPSAFAGALGAPIMGANPLALAGFSIFLWLFVETLLCLGKRWPVSIWSPAAFLGREVLIFFARIRALATDHVVWAGAVRYARARPTISKPAAE